MSVADGEDNVYAVAIRRDAGAEASPRWRVVERLSGPGVARAAGTWSLTPEMLGRLDRGELYLEVFTRLYPNGAARGKIVPQEP